jgi:hypothetical protein
MEGYGSDALTFADVQIFKPGGQALTVRELSGEVTAAQAEFGYNAAVIDGVLTLSLADFKNTTAGQKNNDTVSGVGGTLSGVWQIVSQKPFKSSLVAINAVPGVKSVGLSGSTLSMEFENVTANNGYYYDVTLERKSDADAPPLEALTIVKNAQITNASASLNLTQIKIESATDSDTYDIAAIASSGDWYPRVTLRTGKMESYTIGEDTEQFLITEYVDDKICAEPYAVVNTTLASATWTSNLQAVSGGNQSIDISFDPVETVPTDMAVSGYHVTVYNENGLPASRHATDAEGSQRATLMEYDILAGEDEPNRYEYNIPDVPTGKYAVGVSPMYADLIPETKEGKATGKSVVSAVSRKGKEEKSGAITVNAATPPTLAFSVTGGALVEENGSKYVFFADEDAALTATASGGSTVTYCEFDGTELTAAGGTLTNLSNYSGRTLIVTARNAQGDSTTEYLTLYADATAPLLLPDNYDEGNGAFTFTAYNNTGNYTITGQAAPGAAIGGVIAGDDGRFSIPGKLDDGVNSENFTLTATSAAGLVTMREVRVVRGNVNESAGTPGSSGGRSSGTANSASGGARSYTITTPDGKPAVTGADGTITLPGGGTIKTPEGVTITAPEGTTIKKDGLISIPNEKEAGIVTAGGTQITAPGGTTIALNGRVTPPRTAAATVTLSSGLELNIKEGTTIILDKNVPLGYRAVFENPFADAKAGDWFFDDVGFAYTHGLFAGTGATSFSPNTPMTRGMIVTVLHRLAAEPGADGSAPFGDVSAGQWYTDAVNWAAANGIVGGTGGGLFAPDGDITRQDMAVILMRYAERAGLKLPETRDYPGFKDDADVANYAKEALEAFFKAGIINGKPGGLFDPKGAATRAEAAAMLRRFLETQ